MEIPIDNDQIKKEVMQKMRENRSLNRINDEFRMGLSVAYNDPDDDSQSDPLEYNPFKNADKNELASLQSIFRYLSNKNLQSTLSCLIDESNTNFDPNSKNIIDVQTIINQSDQFSTKQKFTSNFPIDPPIVITQKQFNSGNYIFTIDEL